ncbi:hypothetical protein ACFL4L_01270 [bacterium]
MVGNEYTINRNRWLIALFFSFCLHLLLILIFQEWNNLFLSPRKVEKVKEPLVFNFIQRDQPRTLMETGEASQAAPDQADFLSDKQSIARDMSDGFKENNTMPFAEGQVALGSIQPPPQLVNPKPNEMSEQNSETEKIVPEGIHVRKEVNSSKPTFDRNRLLGLQKPSHKPLSEPNYKELKSSVEESGGISFNTYAWEWAPFMFQLKERIQKNIFPPASFTRLGFGGAHLIRFRIARNGGFTGPDLLGFEGDRVLTETSANAITLSKPFPPLPDDFPESFLEVTVQFRYYGKESQ